MKKENNFAIQKAEKGNTMVILDKDSYLKSIETLLNIHVTPDKDLAVVNSEKRVPEEKLKNKNAINERTYNKLRPVYSKPGTLYGSAKVDKPLKNELPPLRPILSGIGTPTHKLAKFLVPILSSKTQNEFTVPHSFTFVDAILTQHSDLYMASLDVDASCATILLYETIDICI